MDFLATPQMRKAIRTVVHYAAHRFVGIKNEDERLMVARELIDEAKPLLERRGQAQGASAIACQDRCPACCITSYTIGVLPIEMTRIVDTLEREGRLDYAERRAIAVQDREGRRACPLLSRNGRCSVYAERPLVCRSYHSLDREACRPATNVPHIAELLACGLALGPAVVGAGQTRMRHVDLFGNLAAAIRGRKKKRAKEARRAQRAA